MKVVEFQTTLNADHTLPVPGDFANSIPQGQAVRVLVLVPENETDQEWEQLAAMEIGQAYADSDAIYDQLSSR